ncbi:hypothetical protein [Nitriliruptor alkaliphilus]|uniref:hypothetical protein n=1 Tax=Nitriliruptor alkaliphilus TaxID=427918 RepID=UPI000696C857|nr:hypothetical protein [Nitriliruptor alkaliphilus]
MVEPALGDGAAAPEVRGAHTRGRDEAGGAMGSWITQVLVVLAVLGLLGYEAISVGLTSIAVDDASRQVARIARDAYRSSDGSLDQAAERAAEAADVHDADVTDVAIDGEDLTVTLTRRAPTVLLHRFGPTEALTVRNATGRAPLGAI